MDNREWQQWCNVPEDTLNGDYFITGGIIENINSESDKKISQSHSGGNSLQWNSSNDSENLKHLVCSNFNKTVVSHQEPMAMSMSSAVNGEYLQKYQQCYFQTEGQAQSYYDMSSSFTNIAEDDITNREFSSSYSSSGSTPITSKHSTQQQDQYKKLQKIGTYIIEKTIGKGNFSYVKLATHTITHIKVAIKIIDKTKLSKENLTKMYREVQIMKKLKHPNIVKMYQVMETPKILYIVMEYIPNGEVFEYIASHGPYTESEARHRFTQIVSAVEYCHLNHVVHRDLKAENLLLDADMNIKLADFGFGTFYQEEGLLSTWCGSPPYAAPEIFKGDQYVGPKVDIWSLGVVLYVLVCGALPFDEHTLPRLKEQVLCGFFRIPYWMSDACEELIRIMLVRIPSKRPTISRIKDHKWMKMSSESVRPSPFIHNQNTSPPQSQHVPKQTENSAETTTTPPSQENQTYSSGSLYTDSAQYNELAIQIMEQKGMPRKQMMESLQEGKYDHLTATYLLLGERLEQHRQSLPTTPSTYEQVMRRPSSVAEQAILQQQQRSDAHHAHRHSLQTKPQQAYNPTLMYYNGVPLAQASQGPSSTESLQSFLQNLHIRGPGSSDDEGVSSGPSSRRFSAQSTLSSTYPAPSSILGTSIDEGVELDLSGGSDDGGVPCTLLPAGKTSRRHTIGSEEGYTHMPRHQPPYPSACASYQTYQHTPAAYTGATYQQRMSVGSIGLPSHQSFAIRGDSFDSNTSLPPHQTNMFQLSAPQNTVNTSASSSSTIGSTNTPTGSSASTLSSPTSSRPPPTATSTPLWTDPASFSSVHPQECRTAYLDVPSTSLYFKEGRRASDGACGGSLTGPDSDFFTKSLKDTGRTIGLMAITCPDPTPLPQQHMEPPPNPIALGHPYQHPGRNPNTVQFHPQQSPHSIHHQYPQQYAVQQSPQVGAQQVYRTTTKRLSLPSSSPQAPGPFQAAWSAANQTPASPCCPDDSQAHKPWSNTRVMRGRQSMLHQRQHGIYRPLPPIPSGNERGLDDRPQDQVRLTPSTPQGDNVTCCSSAISLTLQHPSASPEIPRSSMDNRRLDSHIP